ncbi:ShlB/FhaC/HecB family hemolysin secretion/activation protein (plasmid) [Burkholderia ambifaria]
MQASQFQAGVVTILAAGMSIAAQSGAQTLPPASVPNAGSILQQKKSEARDASQIDSVDQPTIASKRGLEKRYRVKEIAFVGNDKLSHEELEPLLNKYAGKYISDRDVEEISEKISDVYREKGYGFTFAAVDQDELKDGYVRFVIVEGKAGTIHIGNHTRVRGALLEGMMERFRAHPDNTDNLERASLLISDIPGVATASPRLTRGSENGKIDVEMDVQPTHLINGYASIDNYGSRTSGRTRLNAMLGISNPFGLGDMLRLNVSGFPFNQNGDSTLGGFNYDFPMGTHGMRGGFGFSRLQYHLGGVYANQFDGIANAWTVYASYPIIRQQARSLIFKISYGRSSYKDNQVGFENQRSSDAASASLYGNSQDAFFSRAAVSRFSLTLTQGAMRYDSPLFAAQDASGSKTAGGYSKAEMTLSRMQQLTNSTYLQADVFGQYAFKNLDGSARMVLGGPSAVRAYSSDFVSVDTGVLVKASAGWRPPIPLPTNLSVFYEIATGILRHEPFAGQRNNVNLQGAGIGVDVSYKSFSASLSFATRVGGNAPGIGDQPKNWTWLSLAYSF